MLDSMGTSAGKRATQGGTSAGPTQARPSRDGRGARAMRMTTLSNGLVVAIEPVAGVRSVSVHWLVPAGCVLERPGCRGVSAMLDELLLRGAGDLSSRAQADAAEMLGMSRSVSTGSTHTSICGTMLGDNLEAGLGLVVDMVRRPRFEDEAIEPSRALALMALESLNDDPSERVAHLARARHMRGPFDRSELGTKEGLEATTREDVLEHWSRCARPEGSIVAIAGMVDADRALRRLESLCAGWSGSCAVPAPAGPGPRGYAHEVDESQQVQILALFDAPPERDEAALLERVLVQVLSGGMSGRLFTEVREKRGLCYAVHASVSASRDFGRLACSVGTMPDRAQQSLDVLWAELQRIASPDGAIAPQELAKAKIGLKSSIVMAGESSAARASAMASDAYRLGMLRSLAERAAAVDAVTLDALHRHVAARRPGKATIQTLGPAALSPPKDDEGGRTGLGFAASGETLRR